MAEGSDPLFVNWRTGEPMAFVDMLDTLTFTEINNFFSEKGFRYRIIASLNPYNLYVSTTGSDSNDGRTPSTAFLTWQRAIDEVVGNTDVGNFIPTINIADGVYEIDDDNALIVETLAPFFQINGNTATPANVHLKYTGTNEALAMYGGELLIEGIKITASLGNAIKHDQGYLVLSGFESTTPTVIIGTCAGRQIRVKKNAYLDIGGLTLEGGGSYCLLADRGGVIRILGALNRTGTPTYTSAFIGVGGGGVVLFYGSVSGDITGASFDIHAGGLVKTYQADETSDLDWVNDLHDLFGGTTGTLRFGGQIEGVSRPGPLIDFSVDDDATFDVDISSCSQFRGLRIILQGVRPATDGATLLLRTSSNGGSSYDSGASDYQWAAINAFPIDDLDSDSDTGSSIPLSGLVGNGASEGCDVELTIYNQASETFTTRVKFDTAYVFTAGSISSFRGHGFRNSAANVDALRFMFSSGNINIDNVVIYPLV